MDQNKDHAAFRIKRGGNIDLNNTKLSGFREVVDAENVGNIKSNRLVANVNPEKAKWWVGFILSVLAAVIAAVIAGIILHRNFGIG